MNSPTAPHRLRRCRRLRGAVFAAGVLAACWAGPARPQEAGGALRALEARVRAADAGVLPDLLAAGKAFPEGSSYALRAPYLRLLRQAYLDAGDAAAVYRTDAALLRLAGAAGDRAGMANAELGRVGQRLASDPAAALELLSAIDGRFADVDSPAFLAAVQQLYGDVYVALGQFDFALSHYFKAQALCARHPGLLHPTANAVRLSMANAYVYSQAPDKVLAVLPPAGRDGAALAQPDAARAFIYRGIAQTMLGAMREGHAAYRQALAIAQAHGLARIEANVLANIADAFLQQRDYRQAARAARAAMALAARSGDAGNGLIARANLGFALAGGGQVEQGVRHIDGVAAELRASGSLPDLANVLAEKSRMLARAGRYRQAWQAAQEREEITGRLSAAERERTTAVLREQFDVQQRAVQFENLRRENALKDHELRVRRRWQLVASGGAVLALLLCGFVWRLYRRAACAGRRLEQMNGELAFHSTHDALTGLRNRRSFHDAMDARGAAAGGGACFILLDIDHFKAINDCHGHAAGDAVLVEVARRLRAAVGARGATMRWGGEEFLVHCDGVGAESGVEAGVKAALLRDLLDAVAATPVDAGAGAAIAVSISAGAVVTEPAQVQWQQALARADRALYDAKRGGRNRAWLVAGAAARLVLPGAHGVPAAVDRAARAA
ncbi:diguanylate cyclase [Massilia forsythiae]|uniref:diguanylate cyclase n=1 Tax=Massilia forsythiae TaxID=2728020 RepID=A0A7Z2VZJ3_9BURK|nr:GGDEF domain-containing protein [Massilia forsythiae]QJE02104.1 diguanylate cyclase [Massilia forsythiae]